MSKHTTTHLFFHMNDNAGQSSGSTPFNRKPKRTTTTTGNHELSSSSSFDYYDYFSNYGRLNSPLHSPNELMYQTHDVRPSDSSARYNEEVRRAYSYGDRDRDRPLWRRSGPPKYELITCNESPERAHYARQHHNESYRDPKTGHLISPMGSPESPIGPDLPMVSPPDDDVLKTPDHCLHRITFIETHLYQPQDLPSPLHHSRHRTPPQPPAQHYEWMVTNVQQLRTHFCHPSHQILMNVERKSKFPFIVYSSANADLATCVLSPELRYTDGMYGIVSSLTRPGSGFNDDDSTRPSGFIISAFATFPGEDSDKLERNWIAWSGARIIYKYLPMYFGLRRLLFLKRTFSTQTNDHLMPFGNICFTYVLLCECFNLRESSLARACTTIDQLRARCCGYTALYINQKL